MFGQEELSMHENLCTVVTEFSDAETQKCPMCPYETENKEKLFKHISYRHVLGNNKDCTLVKRKRKEKERSSMKEDSKTGFLTKYQRKQLKKMNGFKFFPKYTSKHVIKGYLFREYRSFLRLSLID
ncbi:hypothetical protein QAD02_019689 [Eretmocerus hayati]|uniref:Uncharacterized protein n=1 Tax=Eretmocerus hayati TaxID=131215 RepID=A0ACC2PKA7_9HYME|nr:hypothetical protein QAD02_019689 [Eretmocerus hayati]